MPIPEADLAATTRQFVRVVAHENIDFLDVGCSSGGSMPQMEKIFGADRGVGCDIDPGKIERARAAGREAYLADFLELPDRPLVRFVSMVHLLEHLPGFDIAHRFLAKSCAVAEDFVFIRQPYFDSDVPLFRLGLKCYWSDWSGHRFTMTSFDMFRIVSRLHRQGECAAFTIGFKEPVTDSSHRYIHSVDSPIDQHEYDGDIHPEKAMDLEFDFPVFKELITVIGMSIDAHAAACEKVYWGTKEVVVEGPA